MELFRVEIQVLGPAGDPGKTLSVLVDTGASYLCLPKSLLISLGYRAIDQQRVVLASGETVTWDVAEVRARLQGRERPALAFMAPDQAPQLLGAQTLETFGLGVDPLGKGLIQVDAYLASRGAAQAPSRDLRIGEGNDTRRGLRRRDRGGL